MSFDPTNQAHRIALRRVRAVQGELPFNCEDGNRDEHAAVNLVEGKPAFASGCSYSNVFGSLLSSAANRLGGIDAAKEELKRDVAFNDRDRDMFDDEALLDRLYPLNRAAELDLMVSYQRVGTWVETSELRSRTERLLEVVPMMVAAE